MPQCPFLVFASGNRDIERMLSPRSDSKHRTTVDHSIVSIECIKIDKVVRCAGAFAHSRMLVAQTISGHNPILTENIKHCSRGTGIHQFHMRTHGEYIFCAYLLDPNVECT